MVPEDYIDSRQFRLFSAAACPDLAGTSAQVRREYGIDPWGTSYWLLVERDNETGHQVTVYSFGPNRRRDVNPSGVNPEDGDDVVATPRERVTDGA